MSKCNKKFDKFKLMMVILKTFQLIWKLPEYRILDYA